MERTTGSGDVMLFDGDAEKIRNAARQRICEIKKKSEKLSVEKKELENMISTCLDCNGGGKVRVISTHSLSRIEECDTCKGTGKHRE